jgi:hypothetical protein
MRLKSKSSFIRLPAALLALTATFGSGPTGRAQTNPLQVHPAVSAAVHSDPKIEFNSTTVEFGRAATGKLLRHDFVFTNTGGATLEITAVRTGCGCTTAGEWTRYVAPGKTGVIPLQLNTTGLSGEITKYTTVVCNDPEQSSVSLELKGDVWKPFDIRPTMTVFSVSDETAENSTKIVRVVSNLTEPITLSDPQSSSSSFRLELKTVLPGKEFEISITALPPFASSAVLATITLKTSYLSAPEITISAQLVVQPAVAALPNRIMLPNGPLATAVSPAVNIRNNGTSTLLLFNAAANVPGVEVSVRETDPNRLFRITATFPAGFELQGENQVEISVRTNHPKHPVIRVPVVRVQPSAFPPRSSIDTSPITGATVEAPRQGASK